MDAWHGRACYVASMLTPVYFGRTVLRHHLMMTQLKKACMYACMVEVSISACTAATSKANRSSFFLVQAWLTVRRCSQILFLYRHASGKQD